MKRQSNAEEVLLKQVNVLDHQINQKKTEQLMIESQIGSLIDFRDSMAREITHLKDARMKGTPNV